MHRMVSAQILRWLTILFASGMITSCNTYRTLYVDVMEPAKVSLPAGSRVAFLDRNIIYVTNNQRIANISRMDFVDLFSEAVNNVFVDSRERDSIEFLERTSRYYLTNDEFPEVLPRKQVKGICEKFNVDYLISFEYYRFANIEEDNEKFLYPECFIRLYSSAFPDPVDSVTCKGKRIKLMDNDIFTSKIMDNGWDIGVLYGKRIFPHWHGVERRVYIGGEMLRLGYLSFQKNEPEQALEIWEAAAKMSPKKAVKAAINMSWMYENNGDFETAARILETARQEAKKKGIHNSTVEYLDEYLKILNDRIKDLELLNYQL